jgi:hypothetical protein
MRVDVLVGFLPAATVGSILTVFVGWVDGLVCGWSGLFEVFASFISASVLGFKSYLLITFIFLKSLGASWITFVAASDVFITSLLVVEVCPYLY